MLVRRQWVTILNGAVSGDANKKVTWRRKLWSKGGRQGHSGITGGRCGTPSHEWPAKPLPRRKHFNWDLPCRGRTWHTNTQKQRKQKMQSSSGEAEFSPEDRETTRVTGRTNQLVGSDHAEWSQKGHLSSSVVSHLCYTVHGFCSSVSNMFYPLLSLKNHPSS